MLFDVVVEPEHFNWGFQSRIDFQCCGCRQADRHNARGSKSFVMLSIAL